jgi:hypothetical protein
LSVVVFARSSVYASLLARSKAEGTWPTKAWATRRRIWIGQSAHCFRSSTTLSVTVRVPARVARLQRAWAKPTTDDWVWEKGLPLMDGLPPLAPPWAAPHSQGSLMPLSSSSLGSSGLNM